MTSTAPERGAAAVAPRAPTLQQGDPPPIEPQEGHPAATISLAVVAAHRTGQPLHPQLLALGATFDRVAITAPVYRRTVCASETAHRVLASARLVAVSADPDGPPIPVLQSSGSVVVEQKPSPGERVQAGSPVTLWFGRGPGSAGVREPLRPRPSPRSTGGAVDEQTGESVR